MVVELLGDGLIKIPWVESCVLTLGLSFQTNKTISHNPYGAFIERRTKYLGVRTTMSAEIILGNIGRRRMIQLVY